MDDLTKAIDAKTEAIKREDAEVDRLQHETYKVNHERQARLTTMRGELRALREEQEAVAARLKSEADAARREDRPASLMKRVRYLTAVDRSATKDEWIANQDPVERVRVLELALETVCEAAKNAMSVEDSSYDGVGGEALSSIEVVLATALDDVADVRKGGEWVDHAKTTTSWGDSLAE